MAALNQEEAAVYDRQIRVWGLETQQRLSGANFLIVGFGGIVAEVAKNVVLAGVGFVSLMDDTLVSDMTAPTFLVEAKTHSSQTVAAVSAAALQEMNPHVKVQHLPGSAANAALEVQSNMYDVVLLANQTFEQMLVVDAACSRAGCAFFAVRCMGTAAFFFANLQSHTCASTEQQEGALKGAVAVEFCPLAKALAAPLEELNPKRTPITLYALRVLAAWEIKYKIRPSGKQDLPALTAEAVAVVDGAAAADAAEGALELAGSGSGDMAAVNAIVGGVLANELLKAVSKKGEPANNLFLYDIGSGIGKVQRLGN